MTKIKITKIKYDPELSEDVKHLPKSMVIEVDSDEYDCIHDDPDEVNDFLEDIVTEKTDVCVKSLNYEVLN